MEGAKQRFSSLKVFGKLGGGGANQQRGGASGPPPVPPKEYTASSSAASIMSVYPSRSFAGTSSTSLVPTQHPGVSSDNLAALDSPAYSPASTQPHLAPATYAHTPSPLAAGTFHQNGSGYFNESSSSSSHGHPSTPSQNPNGGFRKSMMKLGTLTRKPFAKQPSHQAMSALREDQELPPPPKEDPGISIPWGFQHHVHVTEDFGGLPASWAESLAAQGVSEAEILQMHIRAQQTRVGGGGGSSSATSSPVSTYQHPFRPPPAATEDPSASPVIVVGPNGFAQHHPHGLPERDLSGSRPGTPLSGGNPLNLTVRTGGPLTIANATGPLTAATLDTAAAAAQMSPPPSYSAPSHHAAALDAHGQTEKTRTATLPPSRPVPAAPGHAQSTSGETDDSEGAVLDVRALMASDDSSQGSAAFLHSRGPSIDAPSQYQSQSQHSRGPSSDALSRSQHPTDYLRHQTPPLPLPQRLPQVPTRQDTVLSINSRPLEYQELDVVMPGEDSDEDESDWRDDDRLQRLQQRQPSHDALGRQGSRDQLPRSNEQYDSPEENDDEDEDDEDDDRPVALPPSVFKLAALPPRLSLHAPDDGFDFTDSLFSSLGSDALFALAPASPAATTGPPARPPVRIERPPSMLPDSPGLSDGTATPGVRSPATPTPGISSPLARPPMSGASFASPPTSAGLPSRPGTAASTSTYTSATSTFTREASAVSSPTPTSPGSVYSPVPTSAMQGLSHLSPLSTAGLANGSQSAATSAGGISIGDFPMPPSAVPGPGPGSRSASPSPSSATFAAKGGLAGASSNGTPSPPAATPSRIARTASPAPRPPPSGPTPTPPPSHALPQPPALLSVTTSPTTLRPAAPAAPAVNATPSSASSTYSHSTAVPGSATSTYSQGTETLSAGSRYSTQASPNTAELVSSYELASAFVADKPPPTPAKDDKFLPLPTSGPLLTPTQSTVRDSTVSSVRDSTADVAHATIGLATRVVSPVSGHDSPGGGMQQRLPNPLVQRVQSPIVPPSRSASLSQRHGLGAAAGAGASPSRAPPAPLKLGIDVSAPPAPRTPDPRDRGQEPARSPNTAVLSQLITSHFPPSPSAASQSRTPSPGRAPPPAAAAASPASAKQLSGLKRGVSKRKPVPRLEVEEVPRVAAPVAIREQKERDDRISHLSLGDDDEDEDGDGGGGSVLDDWLEDEEEAEATERQDDGDDDETSESALDSWLNTTADEAGDGSTTTPGDSPVGSSHYHGTSGPGAQSTLGKQQFNPNAPTPVLPPRTPTNDRSDVPQLRVDTVGATAPRDHKQPRQQQGAEPVVNGSLPTARQLEPPADAAPPVVLLQGSPALQNRPVYLPAELEAMRPLIHLGTDARALFGEMMLVAQGQYGDVFAVQNGGPPCAVKTAPLHVSAPLTPASAAMTPGDGDFAQNLRAVKVSPKMAMLRHELLYIGPLRNPHILAMDALYFVEEAPAAALWIKMELMVRSLADLVGLAGELADAEGDMQFVIREQEVARFAADTLEALKHIESLGIAHRDVRSDNLLLDSNGVVKLADFSHAVKKVANEPLVCRDIVGVAYWRAAEINTGPYDAMKVDVWSLGATVWELMESEPPFERTKQLTNRWPPLRKGHGASQALRDFLKLCSDPPATRSTAAVLLQTPWIRSACKRPQIVALLEKARQIEESLALEGDEE
ncbi:hypothetical protein BKA62DRAFT_830955 [Auriculariales sp. MPI-PUGE-AT-0066]|nr:hypothetical protein BKA62DRAFT_830955 [Auriculariales sp. MPI-PUGE-AT-0066]